KKCPWIFLENASQHKQSDGGVEVGFQTSQRFLHMRLYGKTGNIKALRRLFIFQSFLMAEAVYQTLLRWKFFESLYEDIVLFLIMSTLFFGGCINFGQLTTQKRKC